MSLKIMLQGTASSVGKSLLTAALCRIFKQDGYSVAPFKSQNMALNSFITDEGLEMGRAQVVQAEAAGIKPSVLMNPVLLKPSSDKNCQVILRGRVYDSMDASEYQKFKPKLLNMIKEDFDRLSESYDIIVIEGAGSPAEINLRDKDIVNMGLAELVNSPVLIVGDIDKGGVFASIAGTLLLLNDGERDRVKGVIINKFRGDLEILKPGIKMLEDIIDKDVIGVVPYTDVYVDEEDGATDVYYKKGVGGLIDIAVINLPHISNFTDFEPLKKLPDVNLRYVNKGERIGDCDVLIIPGSKNTIGDLNALKSSGISEEILNLRRCGKFIVGICGGYQMMGKKIYDPHLIEGPISEIDGLGLLDIETVISEKKVTTQVEAQISGDLPDLLAPIKGLAVNGYEIHMGLTDAGEKSFSRIVLRNGKSAYLNDGSVSSDGKVFGTYIHGIFENSDFVKGFINAVRRSKGLSEINYIEDYRKFKEREYDRLADVVRNSLDIGRIYEIMKGCK
ncbi:cobyric acid synthase CobQ [Thermoanaerobacterium thermosaccharolyticum DSM 571]|jgi:adenosylcobyric acid synthase|uniref:Cobyric acid synthase n=1 Tax=Thermoanaerobacterium thermosaccharolyticum (strain ATCC 7956 / DSM 571 / NCIMB 9385 / NCA 3814 / NCTC 13789 / WDCM 00135 / 2032) TaxID=580327 RepID=D9TQU6_THETC|nr:cobyric acid synthase [Thermoanaerobacterium thermosaccharolyticum]ADL69738.1 cobyric acid synthase CobQ [Thermoanaerobacterium thermosaccharolyticum DSM 571]